VSKKEHIRRERSLTRTVEKEEEKLGAVALFGLLFLLFGISFPADRLTR
jgi:hypothetical protein